MDLFQHRKDIYHHDFLSREHSRSTNFQKKLSKEARYSHFDQIRELSQNLLEEPQTRHPRPRSKKRSHQYYSHQFMTESYLTSSSQLCSNTYIITPRPYGTRCMLVAGNGITIAFDNKGKRFKKFNSNLPSGNRWDLIRNEYVILDCMYCENTFYVVDMLCWKQQIFYDVTADCRLEMARIYLGNLDCTEISESHEVFIKTTKLYRGDIQGLEEAYRNPTEYVKDGLLFYANEGLYIAGVSGMVLLYKDLYCSECPVPDTAEQEAILYSTSQGTLKTLDKKTVWQLDSTTISTFNILKATHLRCRLAIIEDEILQVDVLERLNKSIRPYTLSQILFEQKYRNSPILFSSLSYSISHNISPSFIPDSVYYSSFSPSASRKHSTRNTYDAVYESPSKLIWEDINNPME